MRQYLALPLASIIISGCASVNRGATDYFRIDTVPQGAKATTTIETAASKRARGQNRNIPPIYESCEPTPCFIALPRRSEFIVKLEQSGYENAEMYITNSTNSAAFTANMAATTATAVGTTAGTIAVGSALATGIGTVGAGLVGGTIGASVSFATFGLIPGQTAISTGVSLATSSIPATTTSSALSAAVPPALAVTGGMLLADAATGANVNLFPNPVVLQMAPTGTPIKIDPNVEPFHNKLILKDKRDYYCNSARKDNREKCSTVKAAYSEAVAQKKAAEKAARDNFKAAQKAAKLKENSP